ncbi:MAG: lipoyl synthase [Fibrobacterota bacterium]
MIRKPAFLKRPIPRRGAGDAVENVIREYSLHSVCHSAGCPNKAECFSRRTATFLLLGEGCTRRCTFCNMGSGETTPPEADEPHRIAAAVHRLGLAYVVLTSVTRDDLEDGGALHMARTIRAVKQKNPATGVEVLAPDFMGDLTCVDMLLAEGTDVFGHNIEMPRRLFPSLRPQGDFDRSLRVLKYAAQKKQCYVKSGFMVGLGEEQDEVLELLQILSHHGVSAVTAGQYFPPHAYAPQVQRYVSLQEYEVYRRAAEKLGFTYREAGPYVRSSYGAEKILGTE